MYVSSLIYFFFTAAFFSLSMPIYWLFLILGLISLFDGLALSAWKYEDEKSKKKLVATIISFVSPISFVLNVLSREPLETVEKVNEEPKKEEKEVKPIFKKPSFFVMIISLVLIFVSSFTAQAFATSGFKVETTDFVINKQITDPYNSMPLNGQTDLIASDDASWSVTMYKPKEASETNQLPVVFIMPGFTRTKATMAQYAVEYSKRGAVCFILDPGCQGSTTYAGYYEEEMVSSTIAANGLEYLIHYVYCNTDEFNFIDRDRIGAIGHSAGGGNVVTAASYFAGNNYQQSVIKALYISGYIKASAANNYSKLHCNAVNSYAFYDEGAYRYQTSSTALEVINLRFVNEVSGNEQSIKLNDLKYDYAYGDMSNGTYRMLHREMTNHAFQMYDSLSITNTISFFREALSFDTELDDASHTWFGKEASNGLALISAFTFIISLLVVLVSILKMKGVTDKGEVVLDQKDNSEKEAQKTLVPKAGSFASKALFWGGMLLSAIIACLDFIPLARLSMDLFPEAASNIYTFNFPARMMNAVMLWAVVNGLIGLLIYFGTTLVENLVELIGSKIEHREAHYDFSKFKVLKINWLDLLKSLGLVVILFCVFYGLVALCYALFHQDFRFMLISAAPLQPRYIVTWLMYVPLFFIFYISNSIRVNGSIAREGLKEWQVYLVSALANSIGLVFMLIVNYTKFFVMGEVFYGYMGNPAGEVWLYINMVFALIPLMAVLPILNRFIYKKTGNVYLGAALICSLFIMMSLSASVSYIPM